MEYVRDLFTDLVFGNGRIAAAVVLATVTVVLIARFTRLVKF